MYSLLSFDYFFNPEFCLTGHLQLFFLECSNNFFFVKIADSFIADNFVMLNSTVNIGLHLNIRQFHFDCSMICDVLRDLVINA